MVHELLGLNHNRVILKNIPKNNNNSGNKGKEYLYETIILNSFYQYMYNIILYHMIFYDHCYYYYPIYMLSIKIMYTYEYLSRHLTYNHNNILLLLLIIIY